MNWIKKRYDQFFLVLAALALLAVSGLIALRAQNFAQDFAEAQVTVPQGEKIEALDLTLLKTAQASAAEPKKWQVGKESNPYVFVPARYLVDPKTGQPTKPDKSNFYKDTLTGRDIPSDFFTENNLQLLDPAVPKQDPDKDGFTNEDEWRGTRDQKDPDVWHDSTDPNDPKSHPPLVTKLFLKKWIRVPFRLLFQAVDGDPGKQKPEELSFQMNAIDRGRKTEFLKLGEKVANSPYRLEKFEFKEAINPATQEKTDVSELTVVNTETNEAVVLVKEKVTDSPDSFALFDYQLTGKDIQVKKLQQFVLLPEKDKLFKLIDIKEGQAVIQAPDGGEYFVFPDPRKP